MNSLNNARLRAGVGGSEEKEKYGITAYSHPIKSQANQIRGQSLEQHISDYALSLLMAVVLTFLPASTIIYIIEERRTEQKLVQRTFGVGPFTYWISIILWDLMTNLIFLSLAAIVLYIFQIRSFTAKDNLGASILLMFLFLTASNSFVYIVEKMFSESSFGQIIVLTSFIFISLASSVTMLLLTMFWWIVPLQKAKKILEIVLLLLPPYALSGGFLKLTENQIYNDLFQQYSDDDEGYVNPFSSEVLGRNLLALGLETLFFLVINFIIEILMDESPPTVPSQPFGNILSVSNVTKYYKTISSKFKAVDSLR